MHKEEGDIVGSVLRAKSFGDNDEDCGEYRICSQCRHIFWAEWNDSDEPNDNSPYCKSCQTKFLGFRVSIDASMQRIFELHPEDNPILANFIFDGYPEANKNHNKS